MTTVAISGGFDPVHKGHIRLIKEAAKLGDKLIVILNNDNWLRAKKGFVFMSEDERAEVLSAIKGVDEVRITRHPENPTDMSVCDDLQALKPTIYANGGDRHAGNIPEYQLCEEINIKMEFNVGGEKIQSSSEMVKKANEHL